MNNKLNLILNEALSQIEPSKYELKELDNHLKEFLKKLKSSIKNHKINAEVFVGGSYAKHTLIKKKKYDIDLFVRFDSKKYKDEELSDILNKLLVSSGFNNLKILKGSRNYFSVQLDKNLIIEIIPVRKIKTNKEFKNITDLSYTHVKYINRKIKNPKILKEILLMKSFCHGIGCYGAESYISGFSGYSIELLVYYYKTFVKTLKELSNIKIDKKNKTIIDIEKQFKNKKEVLMNINQSKLSSPIILIDPTLKERNVLAALSEKTFLKFQKSTKDFLKNPDISFFHEQKVDLDKLKNEALKNKNEFIFLESSTDKQEGDIAGSKLLKFYNYLSNETGKYFEIKNKEFIYPDEGKTAIFFISGNPKKELIVNGPFVKDTSSVEKFKKYHKSTFISKKEGRIYAKEPVKINLEEFIMNFKEKYKKQIEQMYIFELKILK